MRRFEINKRAIFHLCVFVLISAIFALSIGFFKASVDDATAHIARIYNLAQSFKMGNYDPFIYESCYLNLGYPYGIFYPDMFLKPFALLVSWGMHEYNAYILMIFLINLSTLLSTYCVIHSINKEKAFLVSMCYFLYPYRLFDLIWRAAIGELFFFVFFPLVILGLYNIFYKNKFSWWLAIGLLGIVNSHILSTALTLFFLIAFYLIKIKHCIKNPKILLWTGINALLVVLCSLKIVIPILEAQLSEKLLYNTNPGFFGTVSSHATQICSSNVAPVVFIAVVIIFSAILYFIFKLKSRKYLSVWLLCLTLILTTNIFPWETIEKIIPFVSILQFPSRILLLASIPFTFLICGTIISEKYKKIILVLLCICSLFGSFAFNSLTTSTYRYEYVVKQGIGQCDYLNSTFYEKLAQNDLSTTKTLEAIGMKINTEVKLDNQYSTQNGYVAKLYYQNYKIKDINNKEYTYSNKDGLIFIPELIDNNITVFITYQPTMLQNTSTWISNISMLLFIVYQTYITTKSKQKGLAK